MNASTFAEWFRSTLESAKFWFMVNPWERAVRVRAGRWSKQIEPGAYFRIPFVDTVTLINTRLRITSTPSITITTMDGKTVTMALEADDKSCGRREKLLTIAIRTSPNLGLGYRREVSRFTSKIDTHLSHFGDRNETPRWCLMLINERSHRHARCL